MKKTILFSLLILLFFSLTNSFVSATGKVCEIKSQCSNGQTVKDCCPIPYGEKGGGLVPCGTPCCPCSLCDIFTLINNIVHLLLFQIVPIVAALLIAVGGIIMIWAYAGGGGPAGLVKAKSLFTSVIIGLLIIYCAWAIVNLFFMTIGVNKWSGFQNGWWKIECGTTVSPSKSSVPSSNSNANSQSQGTSSPTPYENLTPEQVKNIQKPLNQQGIQTAPSEPAPKGTKQIDKFLPNDYNY